MQKPTVGRIVHFYACDGASPISAVIAKVWSEECVNLRLFRDDYPSDDDWVTSVMWAGGPGENNTWVWPPRD